MTDRIKHCNKIQAQFSLDALKTPKQISEKIKHFVGRYYC